MHRGRELDEVAAALADVQARQQSLARGSVLSRASSPSPSVSAVPSPSPSPPPVSKEKTQRAAAPFLWLKRRVVRCSDRKESDALEDLGSLELVSSASLASVRALIGQFIVLPPRREFVFVHPTTNMPVTAAEESDICAGDLPFICLVLLPVKEPPAARDPPLSVLLRLVERGKRSSVGQRRLTHSSSQSRSNCTTTVAAGVAAAVPSDPRPVPVVKRDRVSPGAVRTGRERQVALQPVQEERKQRGNCRSETRPDSKRASSANLPERLKPRQTKITGQDTTDRQGSELLGRRRVASAGSDAVATERKGVEEKLAVSLIPEALHAAQDKALEIVATSQLSPSTQQQVREGDTLQQTLSGDTKIANPAPEIPTSLGKTVHQTPGHLRRSRRFKALTAEKSWGCEEPEEQELATDAEVEDFLQSFLEIVRTGLEDVDARQLDTALLYYGVDYCALKLNGVLLGLDTELGTRCIHVRGGVDGQLQQYLLKIFPVEKDKSIDLEALQRFEFALNVFTGMRGWRSPTQLRANYFEEKHPLQLIPASDSRRLAFLHLSDRDRQLFALASSDDPTVQLESWLADGMEITYLLLYGFLQSRRTRVRNLYWGLLSAVNGVDRFLRSAQEEEANAFCEADGLRFLNSFLQEWVNHGPQRTGLDILKNAATKLQNVPAYKESVETAILCLLMTHEISATKTGLLIHWQEWLNFYVENGAWTRQSAEPALPVFLLIQVHAHFFTATSIVEPDVEKCPCGCDGHLVEFSKAFVGVTKMFVRLMLTDVGVTWAQDEMFGPRDCVIFLLWSANPSRWNHKHSARLSTILSLLHEEHVNFVGGSGQLSPVARSRTKSLLQTLVSLCSLTWNSVLQPVCQIPALISLGWMLTNLEVADDLAQLEVDDVLLSLMENESAVGSILAARAYVVFLFQGLLSRRTIDEYRMKRLCNLLTAVLASGSRIMLSPKRSSNTDNSDVIQFAANQAVVNSILQRYKDFNHESRVTLSRKNWIKMIQRLTFLCLFLVLAVCSGADTQCFSPDYAVFTVAEESHLGHTRRNPEVGDFRFDRALFPPKTSTSGQGQVVSGNNGLIMELFDSVSKEIALNPSADSVLQLLVRLMIKLNLVARTGGDQLVHLFNFLHLTVAQGGHVEYLERKSRLDVVTGLLSQQLTLSELRDVANILILVATNHTGIRHYLSGFESGCIPKIAGLLSEFSEYSLNSDNSKSSLPAQDGNLEDHATEILPKELLDEGTAKYLLKVTTAKTVFISHFTEDIYELVVLDFNDPEYLLILTHCACSLSRSGPATNDRKTVRIHAFHVPHTDVRLNKVVYPLSSYANHTLFCMPFRDQLFTSNVAIRRASAFTLARLAEFPLIVRDTFFQENMAMISYASLDNDGLQVSNPERDTVVLANEMILTRNQRLLTPGLQGRSVDDGVFSSQIAPGEIYASCQDKDDDSRSFPDAELVTIFGIDLLKLLSSRIPLAAKWFVDCQGETQLLDMMLLASKASALQMQHPLVRSFRLICCG
ncbi:hypothetical protein GQ600_24737 [Phytophthora cactorum]|nr:hypothetical protein GQ600_24737 [Phytophthora cactorum]